MPINDDPLADLKAIQNGPRIIEGYDGQKLMIVPFTPGNGHYYPVVIDYIAYDFPRSGDKHGTCAFCQGDPCNEDNKPGSLIARYYADTPHADTCPMCDGRPT